MVGRVVLLTEEGTQLESAPPGPLVRLTGVREWSVEYDELNVTIWVSTDVADYKLFTPAPLYANMWAVLQRKAALAARLLMLLADEPTMTYKTLVRLCVKCNSIPNAIQFKADEVLTYGTFLAEQIANGEGLDGCRALIGLREAIFKKEADEVAKADAEAAARGEASSDPNKRQRKKTTVFEAAPSHTPRAKPLPKKADEKDPKGGTPGGRTSRMRQSYRRRHTCTLRGR